MPGERKLYEFLVRCDPTGAPVGVHAAYWSEVIRDGVTSYEAGEAVPVDLIDPASSGLITTLQQDALLQVSKLQTDIDNLRGLNDALAAGLRQANGEIEALTSEKADLERRLAASI